MEVLIDSRSRRFLLVAAPLGLRVGGGVLGLLAPRRTPVWLFYLASILLWALMPSGGGPLALAGFCFLLTLFGLFLSPSGAPFTFTLINRSFGCVLFWIAAYTAAHGTFCSLATTRIASHNQASKQLDQDLQRLKTLTQDNPVQENLFPALEAKIAEKPAQLRQTVMARWNEGPGGVFRIVMGDQGTTTRDEIRSALAEMEGIEHGLLVERRQLSGNMFLAMLLYLGLGGLLQIGLLVAAGLFVQQPQIADQVRIKSETATHEALVLLRGTRAIAPNLVTVGHAI